MKRIIAFWFIACVSAFGAEYAIPSSRLPGSATWSSAGVPGGIPTRTIIYTTITSTGDTTDRSATINAALAACPSDQVVLLGPGTFVISGSIGVGYGASQGKTNITLRGSTNTDGSPASIIDARGSGYAVNLGTGFAFNWPTNGEAVTVATLTKGATNITVADSSDFSNGQLVMFFFANEEDTPVMSVTNQSEVRSQIAKIANSGGVPNSTTIVLDAPGIHGDHTALSGATVYTNQLKSTGLGIESIEITGINSGDAIARGINVDSAYGCWIYNVKISAVESYDIAFYASYRCEVRQCWLSKIDGGSSSGALFVEWSTSILAINNVLTGGPVGIFQQQKCSGNVYAYNLLVNDGGSISTNINHGPWCEFTLIEGNIGGFYQNDGYFGGSGYGTIFRNWYMGNALDTPTSYFTVVLNKFTRFDNLVGNVFGKTGIGGGGYSFGNPNISNGFSGGVASMRGALSTLASRTSDSVGTITAPSGHGITTGSTIDVYWTLEVFSPSYYQTSHIRRDVTVGTVSGTSIPISGGLGDALPSELADIFVPTTNSALWAYSLDWDSSTGGPRLWPGELTTRTNNTSGVVTLDSGEVTSFSAALANTVTSYADERGLQWATGSLNAMTITGVSGDEVSVSVLGGGSLPALSTSVWFVPSYPGFQEQDLDVILTTLLKANYLGLASGSGIPAVESIGSDTLANSMFLNSTPDFFTVAGVSWPPINPNSPNESTYEIIPAGIAYNDGWWPQASGTSPTYTPGRLRILRR